MRVIRWKNSATGVESLNITTTGIYFPVGKTDSSFKLKLSMAAGGQTASVDTVRDSSGSRTGYGAMNVSGTTETKLGAVVSFATGIIVTAISGTLNAILDDEIPITNFPEMGLGRFPTKEDADAYVYGATVPRGLPAIISGTQYTYGGPEVRWVAGIYDPPLAEANGGIYKNRQAVQRILTVSESILGAGNFSEQLAAATGASVIADVCGGSEIGIALASHCTKSYTMMRGENSIEYSDDMVSGSCWSLSPGKPTLSRSAYQYAGRTWTKLVKTDAATGAGLIYSGTLPTTFTSFLLAVDVMIPSVFSAPPTSLQVRLRITGLSDVFYYNATGLPVNKKFRLFVPMPAAGLSIVPASGAYTVTIQPNPGSTSPAFDGILFSRASIAWNSPGCYENYVKTSGAQAVPGTATLTEIQGTNSSYADADVAIISYGRNDSNNGAGHVTFFSAYSSLVRELRKQIPIVIPGNPPPKNTNGSWDISTDAYYLSGYSREWTRFIASCGGFSIDAWKYLRLNRVASNVMIDTWHPNYAGASDLVSLYSDAMYRGSCMVPYGAGEAFVVLTPSSTVGTVSDGTWIFSKKFSPTFSATEYPAAKPFGGVIASTVGSSVTFVVPECRNIWLVYNASNAGSATVITATTEDGDQVTVTLSAANPQGRLLFSSLPAKSHTITLYVNTPGSTPITISGLACN